MKTVYATFDQSDNGDLVLDELSSIGYSRNNVSVILKENDKYKMNSADTTVDNAKAGAVSGGTVGGVVGGIAGLLIGIGALTIPGIGALLIGGPIAAALGLTGAAATTFTGAATGAVAGGLLGALTNLGIPENVAKSFEDRVNAGDLLLGVDVDGDDEEQEVKSIFRKYNGEDITVVSS